MFFRDYDPDFEGLGLWKFCRTANGRSTCRDLTVGVIPGEENTHNIKYKKCSPNQVIWDLTLSENNLKQM